VSHNYIKSDNPKVKAHIERLERRDRRVEHIFRRCLHLLESMEEKSAESWNLMMGKVCLAQNNPKTATMYLLRAGETGEVYGLLERCYRELEDYKQAYFYAVKRK